MCLPGAGGGGAEAEEVHVRLVGAVVPSIRTTNTRIRMSNLRQGLERSKSGVPNSRPQSKMRARLVRDVAAAEVVDAAGDELHAPLGAEAGKVRDHARVRQRGHEHAVL